MNTPSRNILAAVFARCLQLTAALAAITLLPAQAGPLPTPQQGVYRGAVQTSRVDSFATWLDQPGMWALDFEADDTWANIAGPAWILNPWQTWVAARPGRRLILSVPMLPSQDSAATLAKGANGDYNVHFRTLAANLIAKGLGNTVVRPGWEFNGGWYKWAAKDKQASYIGYWRQIHRSMMFNADGVTPRAGANFTFCWNPNLGYEQFPSEQAYPGDEYVDYVGLDVYDQSWIANTYPWPETATAAEIEARRARVWNERILNGNHGLVFWRNFCTAHNKAFVLPEWGLMDRTDGHGGKDNAAFISNMHNYITTYPVAWAAYFDYNNSVAKSQISPGSFHPLGQARFLELFSGSHTVFALYQTGTNQITYSAGWGNRTQTRITTDGPYEGTEHYRITYTTACEAGFGFNAHNLSAASKFSFAIKGPMTNAHSIRVALRSLNGAQGPWVTVSRSTTYKLVEIPISSLQGGSLNLGTICEIRFAPTAAAGVSDTIYLDDIVFKD